MWAAVALEVASAEFPEASVAAAALCEATPECKATVKIITKPLWRFIWVVND